MHFRPRLLCVVVFICVWKRRCADVRAGTQAPPLRFRLGGLRVNGYFVCVGLCGKILRSVVGAVPVCPPVLPHKGASIVKIPAHNACASSMETPLCGRSGGHTGTAPTVSFGWIACGWFCLFVGKTVHMNQHHRCCTFDSPGLIERSEIYPGERRREKIYAIGIVLSLNSFACGAIIRSSRVVMFPF